MLDTRCLIAWQNWADAATVSGGSWLASLPAANVLDPLIKRVARSVDDATASTQFVLDLGKPRAVSVLAIANHNLSTAGRVRFCGSDTTSFTAPKYDSGWLDAWPVAFVPEMLEWQDPQFWSGRMSTEARLSYSWIVPHLLADGATKMLRYWRVEIDDTANEDGYVQVGRVFLGRALRHVWNMSYGGGLGLEARTEVEEAPGGAEYFEVRPSRRVARISLDYLSTAEAASAIDLQAIAGTHGDVLFLWDRSDTWNRQRRSFLGRMRQLSPIEHPYCNTHSTPFEIAEKL